LFSKFARCDDHEAILIPQRGIFFRKIFQRRQGQVRAFCRRQEGKRAAMTAASP
jgi:hypothetical protein